MHNYSYTIINVQVHPLWYINASVLPKLVCVHFTAVEWARLENLLYI